MVDLREAAARVLRRIVRARRRIAIVVIAALCLAVLLVAVLLVLRARSRDAVWADVTARHRDARLASRPHAPGQPLDAEGVLPLGLGGCELGRLGVELDLLGCRDGILYAPRSRGDGRPLGLIVLLHGGYSEPERILAAFTDEADRRGWLLLVPASRGPTWDRILVGSGFGPDVAFIDRALAHAFDRFTIDPQRIAVVGFSDGATYALSLGLANGDLFHKIVAFSPGGVAGDAHVGTPDVFVSHGRDDEVLRIDECSRVVVPQLPGSGYDVTYEEFDCGHTMPPVTFARAMAWLGN